MTLRFVIIRFHIIRVGCRAAGYTHLYAMICLYCLYGEPTCAHPGVPLDSCQVSPSQNEARTVWSHFTRHFFHPRYVRTVREGTRYASPSISAPRTIASDSSSPRRATTETKSLLYAGDLRRDLRASCPARGVDAVADVRF